VRRQARLSFERLDSDGIQRTPQGGLRIPARMTRTGVFVYRDALTGRERRELRHPDDVFAPSSMASLRDAPVTDLHPAGLVTAETYKRDGVGHVSGLPRRDGRYVAGEVVVQSGDTVRRVDARERVEISLGYTCEIEERGGVYEGERYDVRQREILYNHCALGPRDWGRAGNEVSLRLDAGDAAVQVRSAPTPHLPPSAPTPRPRTMRMDMADTIRIDGIPYEVGSPAQIEAQAAFEQRTKTRIDTLERELADANKRADEASGRAETLDAELKSTKTKLDEATSPARLDALAVARARFLEGARKILGKDARLDGLTDREIRVKAIVTRQPKLDGQLAEASDDSIRARFDTLVELASDASAHGPKITRTRVDEVSDRTPPPTEPRPDETRLDAIRRANEEFYREDAVKKRFTLHR